MPHLGSLDTHHRCRSHKESTMSLTFCPPSADNPSLI